MHVAPFMDSFMRRGLAQKPIKWHPFPPLLEVEGHTSRITLIAQRPRPIGVHWPRARTGLAADNHPVHQFAPSHISRTGLHGKPPLTFLLGPIGEVIGKMRWANYAGGE